MGLRKLLSILDALDLCENETSKWLMLHLLEGMTFIDAGANKGYFSLLAARKIGFGRVVAFEPIPRNIRTIYNNIKLNNISNIVIEEAVLANTDGEYEFCVLKNIANSHIKSIKIEHANCNEIDLIYIKSYQFDLYIFAKNLVPNLIKIDVEGTELIVLKTSLKTLKKY